MFDSRRSSSLPSVGSFLHQRARLLRPPQGQLGQERSFPRHKAHKPIESSTTFLNTAHIYWMVVLTPLTNISQMGLVFPINGKM